MITIVDYGMGNVQSVRNALSHLGAPNAINADPQAVAESDALILPGVGSFHTAMTNIRDRQLLEALNHAVARRGALVLGICLGMQLFAEIGHEGGRTAGLGWIEGEVRRLAPREAMRLPHIGFNTLTFHGDGGGLFQGLGTSADYYFVHSYHFVAARPKDVIGTCDYGETFAGAVHRGNVWGVQFHPEKSQGNGLRLLANFARMCACAGE